MKILFISENSINGKIPRTHSNMRTEFAWMSALDADHCNINCTINGQYDLGIVIIPKNNPNININIFREFCTTIAIMQEGPSWYFQDYSIDSQIQYIKNLQSADIIFVHNTSDQIYFSGLINNPSKVKIMRSLMIEDAVGYLPEIKRSSIIIGGNFCSWYGGMDSYIVAKEINVPIYIPSMGRKLPNEEKITDLNHLPYLLWSDWIKALNHFKYGIHLMKTFAAGTFSLNCSYLGIPCIAYDGLDTQAVLHPDLTIKQGDLPSARKLLNRLYSDDNFYRQNSELTRELYLSRYHEKVWIKDFFNNL